MMMQSSLSCEEVSSGYGDAIVLRNVTLEAGVGQVVGIVGPNGAGKTTLLKTIMGLTKTFGGKITFEGKTISGLPAQQVLRRGVAYVSQDRAIFSRMSVKENLAAAAHGLRGGKQSVDRKVEEVMRFLPQLKSIERLNGWNLSGGQRKVLAIAMGLMIDAKLLLLDEPSLGLDPKNFSAVFEIVCRLKSMGICILLAEQNLTKIVTIFDKVYAMDEGMIADEGTPEEIAARLLKVFHVSR
jgi:branched-chain amino acid transport system ATP-binding protein